MVRRPGAWAGVVAVTLSLAGLGALASTPARADDQPPGTVVVDVDNQVVGVTEFCAKSTTTKKTSTPRICSGRLGSRKTHTLYVPAAPGDDIWMDIFVVTSKSRNDNLITGSHQCTATGTAQTWKMVCPGATQAVQTFTTKPLDAFAVDVGDPEDPEMRVLNLMAWAVTAAAVAGLLIVGINLAVQLQRGTPGEFGEHWRGLVLIAISCIVTSSAGPLVQLFVHS